MLLPSILIFTANEPSSGGCNFAVVCYRRLARREKLREHAEPSVLSGEANIDLLASL